MKKVFYSIGLVSAMMFTACSTEDKGTSTEVVDSNEDNNVNPNNINDYDQPGTAGSTASTTYTDADYQQHAQQVTDQMTRDIQLDNATATKITRIYYNRNTKLGELEQGTNMNSTERMGGQTNESSNMNSGNTGTNGTNQNNTANNSGTTGTNQSQMNTDRTGIDDATDREIKNVLTPEQYRKYEQNRDKYNNMQMNSRSNGTMNNGTGTNSTNGNTTGTNRSNTTTGTNGASNTTGVGTGTNNNRPANGNQ